MHYLPTNTYGDPKNAAKYLKSESLRLQVQQNLPVRTLMRGITLI